MRFNAYLSITRIICGDAENFIRVTIRDRENGPSARIQVDISLEELTLALTGQADIPAKGNIHQSFLVGIQGAAHANNNA